MDPIAASNNSSNTDVVPTIGFLSSKQDLDGSPSTGGRLSTNAFNKPCEIHGNSNDGKSGSMLEIPDDIAK